MQKVGDEYFDSEEFRELLADYEDADASGHSRFFDADDLTDIADYYHFIGDTKKSIAAIDTAIENFPGAAGPLVFKAREALKNEDLQSACNYAETIDDKSGIDYHYINTEILIAQDKTDEADTFATDFYDSCTDDDDREDFAFDVCELFVDYAVFDKANEWLERIDDHDDKGYKEQKGKVLMGLERYDESIEVFDELIDQDPYSSSYWNLYANAYLCKGDVENAMKGCGYALAINPDDEKAIYTRAMCYFNSGNYKEAIDDYSAYLEKNPSDMTAEVAIASCYSALERYDEAIYHLDKAEMNVDDSDPYKAIIFENLAFAYNANEDYNEALYCIKRCRDYDCDHIDTELLRANIYLANGDITYAGAIFAHLVQDEDCDAHALLRIIICYVENGYYDIAYDLFDDFYKEVDDGFNDGFSYLALCCYKLKHYDQFEYFLKYAPTFNPTEAREVLGFLFPEGVEPADYYDYYIKNIKKEKTE